MNCQAKILMAAYFSIFPMLGALGEESSAKVIMMRGAVKAKLKDGSIIDVKINQALPEGALVQTADKSFVKIILADKSQINLGPNSQMAINALPKTQAGIITLVKGQIRSQVSKDYMQIEDKSKSKLYIKTKTAAMGVRGTDFQVNYNTENKNTVLITFEGKVALSNIDLEDDVKLNHEQLEKIVSNEKAVLVTEGKISAINFNISPRAMLPTKLNPIQIELLEKNPIGVSEDGNGDKEKIENKETKVPNESDKNSYRNPIPPGVDGAKFSNEYRDGIVAKKTDESTQDKTNENPNAYFNKKTGEYRLPSGSLLDLKTLNIVPPPINAIFDRNTQTYIIPDSLGKLDTTTGEYIPPQGLILDSSGQFVPAPAEIPPSSSTEEGTSSEERSPGSTDTSIAPSTNLLPPPPTSIYDTNTELKEFQEIYSPTPLPETNLTGSSTTDSSLTKLAEETQTKTEQDLTNSSNIGTALPTSKVKFIIDVK